MPGPGVLSNYVVRVVSRGPGILSSFSHPSWVVSLVLQNLIGAPWSSYRHTKSIFLVLKVLFILAPASAGCIGVFHAVSYCGSHSRGWSEVSFSFVPGFLAKTQDPSTFAPRAGFTVPAQPNARQSHWEIYILCGQSGVTWTALLRIINDASVSFLPQGVARRSYRRPLSPSGSRCCCHRYAGSQLRNGLFVSLELGALVLSLRLFFEKNFAVIRWEGEYVVLAHILAVLLLRGGCPLVPRRLPPGLCGSSAGPGFTRACSPKHITAY